MPAKRAGDPDGDQQVDGNRGQPDPQWIESGCKRKEDIQVAQVHIAVGNRGNDMHSKEGNRGQGQGAVQPEQSGPGQPGQPGPSGGGDAQHHDSGEQHQRDGTRCTAGKPEDLGVHAGTATGSAAGQPLTAIVSPSRSISRAGNCCSVSQCGAAEPRTIAAGAAVLASTQQPAATETVRQVDSGLAPVRGSTM